MSWLKVTAVGFEPTPFRTGALSQRLRPLGQTVLFGAIVRTQTPNQQHCARSAGSTVRCKRKAEKGQPRPAQGTSLRRKSMLRRVGRSRTSFPVAQHTL